MYEALSYRMEAAADAAVTYRHTLAALKLLLHAFSYTPTLTRLLLHAYSYTPTPTRLQQQIRQLLVDPKSLPLVTATLSRLKASSVWPQVQSRLN